MRPPPHKEMGILAPKGNTPLGLICYENNKEEFTHLLNHEYNLLREK